MSNCSNTTRRAFISGLGTLLATGGASRAFGQQPRTETFDELLNSPISEEQLGDPPDKEHPYEVLVIRKPMLQKAVGDDPVGPWKNAKALGEKMLEITRQHIKEGVSRTNKASQVLEFLRVVEEDGIKTAFCAAGVSYAACRAYCDLDVAEAYSRDVSQERQDKFRSKLTTIAHYYFYPSSAVRLIKAAAIKHNNWVSGSAVPLPGWLVIFTWDKDSAMGNHIGLVETAKDGEDHITTLEYNTSLEENGSQGNGGHVARRTRKRNWTILGYVRI